MKETRATYRLKRFESSSDKGFSDAIKVYTRSIPPSLKTNSNEIAYWLDNQDKKSGDLFIVYGFYVNNKVVGFAEFAFFRDERLLVVDYLVVDEKFRRHNVFFEFAEHLRESLQSERIDIDYVVAEVGYLSESEQPSEYSRSLIRLLKFMGLGLIKAPYMQPQLGSINLESQMKAALMISTVNLTSVPQIKVGTYLKIVETIYYKHYLRWYRLYVEDAESYKRDLDSLYEQIRRSLAGRAFVEVNGHKDLLQPPSSTVEPLGPKHFKAVYISMLVFIVSTALLLVLKITLDVSTVGLVIIYAVIMASFFAVMALFSKEASRIFDALLSFILSFRPKK